MMSTKTMAKSTKPRPGAITLTHRLAPCCCRRKNPITATDTTVISNTRPMAPLLVSQVNMVSTGYSSPSSEPDPATAKAKVTTTAITVCANEPAKGAPLPTRTLASVDGRTRSRPREKK
ncbi:hypothetical protein D3C73_956600 [compost metagenome]